MDDKTMPAGRMPAGRMPAGRKKNKFDEHGKLFARTVLEELLHSIKYVSEREKTIQVVVAQLHEEHEETIKTLKDVSVRLEKLLEETAKYNVEKQADESTGT